VKGGREWSPSVSAENAKGNKDAEMTCLGCGQTVKDETRRERSYPSGNPKKAGKKKEKFSNFSGPCRGRKHGTLTGRFSGIM
jgi:hypothetical protein